MDSKSGSTCRTVKKRQGKNPIKIWIISPGNTEKKPLNVEIYISIFTPVIYVGFLKNRNCLINMNKHLLFTRALITLSVISLFGIKNSMAQQLNQFAVDTVSGIISEPLPFDRPLILKVRGSNSTSIISAFILEWKIKNQEKRFVMDTSGIIPKFTFVPRENVFKRKDGVDIYIPPLKPSKNLAFLFAHQFDGSLLDDIYKANLLIHRNDTIKAKAILDDIPKQVESKVKPIFGMNAKSLNELKKVTTFNSGGANNLFSSNYIKYFNQTLKPFYVSTTSLIRSNTYTSLSIDSLRKALKEADSLELTSAELTALAVLVVSTKMGEVQSGEISLETEPRIAEQYDLPKRLANLNSSIKSTEKIKQTIKTIIARKGASIAIDNDLTKFAADLLFNRNLIRNQYELIKDSLANNRNLNYPSWAQGSNELTDLKTRSSYQVIPEIGVVTIYAIGNQQNEFIVRPYFGASIYLRPVDKSIPYKYIRYEFLHRFSFNLGVTAGKINKGEFSDLFNNATLLLGGNYKIFREMSFSLGTAIMQRKNHNPAIDSPKVSFNLYAGLSFDVDLANGIQKLTGKLLP
ncbi:hypothetical protein [Runella slithyformis]|uniref:Uncharacterized protein n=1 Tax=Runella slithyformis (strain ATCC 29530 / DSM 19594 / LMG 11500 / NCIMB 11436 / LSU 4) TaxID=761193 RepID=A0A7U3ZM18_RUNSL|nr:hypothetical protein [Runella slithyformis]AEI49705.1 hypothetical protein Runsl_3337 [Runella slithyformis DSM 19594]